MEPTEPQPRPTFQETYRELLRTQAKEKVDLANDGLFREFGPLLDQKHLKDKAALFLQYPGEEGAILRLGTIAFTPNGLRAIAEAMDEQTTPIPTDPTPPALEVITAETET